MTSDNSKRIPLPISEPCFVCGKDNPAGLRTEFYVVDGQVRTDFRPQPHHCGYQNTVHGGIVATILDETMGWAAARAITRMCLTGELTVRYLTPVPGDRVTTVFTEVVQSSRRMVRARGWIAENGTIYAKAEGRFLPLSVEETLAVDDALLYRGGEERVFAPLREHAEGRPSSKE